MLVISRIPLPNLRKPDEQVRMTAKIIVESDTARCRHNATFASDSAPRIALQRCKSIAKSVKSLMQRGSVRRLALPKIAGSQRGNPRTKSISSFSQQADYGDGNSPGAGCGKRRTSRSFANLYRLISVHRDRSQADAGIKAEVETSRKIVEKYCGKSAEERPDGHAPVQHGHKVKVAAHSEDSEKRGDRSVSNMLIERDIKALYVRFHTKRNEPVVLHPRLEAHDELFFGLRLCGKEPTWTLFGPDIGLDDATDSLSDVPF